MTTTRRTDLASASILLAVLASCGGARDVDFFQTVQPVSTFPGTPGDEAAYATYFAYTPITGCDPVVPRVLDARTEVRLFLGNGITDDDGLQYLRGLQRYYAHYGVSMYTRYEPIRVPMDHVMVMNEGAIIDWMRENTSVDPNSNPSEGTAAYREYLNALGSAMYFNLKQFLRAYAEPFQNVINVVLVKRVAALDPSDSMALDSWGVAGLGLSDEVLTNYGADGDQMRMLINETNFSPTIFISVNLLNYMMKYPDIVVAHEFGHCYGLIHTSVESNLMYGTALSCDESLNASQLTTIEQNTARYGNVIDLSVYKPLEFLSWNHRAPEMTRILMNRLQAKGAR